ncbi:MAG: glycosyltransferase family 2 protein, partial [Lachnospiraceae bacterium]|nr:glycosyltransferase family 2 protein [Lachnospiraceae bacterium]
ILVPLYETDEYFLNELIKSVKNQTYDNWELCFSDGSKDSERLKKIISNYSKSDKRIKFIAEKKGPLGISDNTNQAYELATGDYIVLGDHDDLFTPDALYECVKVLNTRKVDVIYTDEDKTDEKGKKFFGANFKPDFNIDLLRSCNYICHMFVASKKLVDCVGTFNSEFDGAQDYDFILRCVEKANEVYHIPKVLYRWRAHSNSTSERPDSKLYAFDAGRRAIEAHYKRLGIEAVVEDGDHLGQYKTTYKIIGNPLISIVIPNKDHVEDLRKCMNSVDEKSDYKNYEYVIVENNSVEDITFDFYKEIEKRDNVKVLYWDKEFNYSAINNFGVKEAKGEYILLLNNDIEVINGDWLSQMLGYCQREDVGIVGARLYYEDDTIQHAGVVIGFGGIAGHTFVTLDEDSDLYQSRTKVACDYSAVTAACLMTKKKIYDEVGGLEEAFKVAFNDIDFCMKVRALGKLVVYNANAKLHHYESKSRGAEDTFEKKERFNSEIRLFRSRWPEIL